MLSSRELQRGRGGCHESTTRGTGPGDPWAKRFGDYHRAGRRCGAAHWADGQDGFAGGLGPAYPPPLEATQNQLGVDGRDLVGIYPHGRRPSEGVGRNGVPAVTEQKTTLLLST